jgi:hypothetical protein
LEWPSGRPLGVAGLLFVVAVVLMASAPWVLLQSDQETRTELNRWFLTVAGSVDVIVAGVLLALAQRPHRTLLIVEHAGRPLWLARSSFPSSPRSPHPGNRRGPAEASQSRAPSNGPLGGVAEQRRDARNVS